MPKRFVKHTGGKGGWTEWIHPAVDQNYLMECCDCGLVHEVQFGVFAEVNQKRTQFEVVDMPWPLRAKLRVRRAVAKVLKPYGKKPK